MGINVSESSSRVVPNPRSEARERRSGFTLIELMIVVLIIAALAGMVAPRLIGRSDVAKAKIAMGELAGMKTALKLYRLENNRYPTGAEGLAVLLAAPPGGGEPYLEGDVNDPWDQPYRYEQAGADSLSLPRVYSSGADRNPGTADDVSLTP